MADEAFGVSVRDRLCDRVRNSDRRIRRRMRRFGYGVRNEGRQASRIEAGALANDLEMHPLDTRHKARFGEGRHADGVRAFQHAGDIPCAADPPCPVAEPVAAARRTVRFLPQMIRTGSFRPVVRRGGAVLPEWFSGPAGPAWTDPAAAFVRGGRGRPGGVAPERGERDDKVIFLNPFRLFFRELHCVLRNNSYLCAPVKCGDWITNKLN